jgi:hypothetical protein
VRTHAKNACVDRQEHGLSDTARVPDPDLSSLQRVMDEGGSGVLRHDGRKPNHCPPQHPAAHDATPSRCPRTTPYLRAPTDSRDSLGVHMTSSTNTHAGRNTHASRSPLALICASVRSSPLGLRRLPSLRLSRRPSTQEATPSQPHPMLLRRQQRRALAPSAATCNVHGAPHELFRTACKACGDSAGGGR